MQGWVYIHDQARKERKQKEWKTKGGAKIGDIWKNPEGKKTEEMTNDEKPTYHSLMRHGGEVERTAKSQGLVNDEKTSGEKKTSCEERLVCPAGKH